MPRAIALTAVATVLLIAAVIAFLLVRSPEEPARAEVVGVPATSVVEEPDRYAGEPVTVTGEVSVLTERVMSLGDEDLIVVAAPPLDEGLQGRDFFVGDVVHATGTVHLLDSDGVTDRLPDVSILPSQFQEFDRQAVLFATAVTSSDRVE